MPLAKVPVLLSDLDSTEVDWVLGKTVTRRYPPNDWVFKEGDPSSEIYMITKGTVAIRKQVDKEQSECLAVLCEGDHFGEMALISDDMRSAGAQTLEEVVLWVLSQEGMATLLEERPRTALKMCVHLLTANAERLRRTNDKIREFALKAETTRREIEHLKSEIITLVSHEFRTPLSVIQGSVESLDKKTMGEEHRRKVIQLITRQTSQLTRLLEDVSYLSSLSETGMTFNPDHVVIEEILDEVYTEHQTWLGKLQLSFKKNWGKDKTTLTGDRAKIRKAISHLVNNAIKYNSKKGEVKVTLKLRNGPAAEIRIEDTGVGIAPDAMDRIYENFKKPTLDRGASGLGIGLPLARSIVQGHGGTLTIDSEKGKGTAVTVVLPLEPASLKPAKPGPLLQGRPEGLAS